MTGVPPDTAASLLSTKRVRRSEFLNMFSIITENSYKTRKNNINVSNEKVGIFLPQSLK